MIKLELKTKPSFEEWDSTTYILTRQLRLAARILDRKGYAERALQLRDQARSLDAIFIEAAQSFDKAGKKAAADLIEAIENKAIARLMRILPPILESMPLLAAVDVWEALVNARPARPAHPRAAAAKILQTEADDGRLCPRAVATVLAITMDKPVVHMGKAPAFDLTPREIDVLVEVARGSTNKEIASALGISPRSAKHHLENGYGKIGVSTRSGAALFAARQGIVRLG